MPPTDRLTVDEAATELNLHPATIRRAINTGQLPAFNIGGDHKARRLRITREAIEQYRADRNRERPAFPVSA